MKYKVLLLSFTALAGCSAGISHETGALNTGKALRSDVDFVRQDQSDTNKATGLMQKLGSNDEAEREQAKKEIRSLLRESAESREQVIQELIKLVEKSDTGLRFSSKAHYDAWSFAVGLLGELKATESLDALVACIECNDGVAGLSFDGYPVLRAVIEIGPPAVPKLTEALRDSRPATRKYAALALGEIGGDDAKKALQSALLSEQDKEIETTIRIALRLK
jgi:HEAT repeat protein